MSGKIAFFFFFIGMIAALVGMVSGPFGKNTLSITLSLVASILAVFGIILGFDSWKESPDYGPKKSSRDFSKEATEHSAADPQNLSKDGISEENITPDQPTENDPSV